MSKEAQLFVVQVDNCLMYPHHAEQYLQAGQQFRLHVGGRGNGAVAGLYTEKQLGRIIGKYPEGVARAIPVVIGKTEKQEASDADDLLWLDALEAAGVDNWVGIDEARDIKKEMDNG